MRLSIPATAAAEPCSGGHRRLNITRGPRNFWSGCGATENARPENAGLENDGQLRKESQGLENAGLENDGQNFSQLWAKLGLRGLENAGLENNGPC